MRKKTLATLSAAGLLTAGLVATSAGPAIAQTGTPQIERQGAPDRIGTSLADLVADGVLTQEQADAVSDALTSRRNQAQDADRSARTQRGVRGVLAIDVAADVLGMERSDLATQLRAGTSLAEMAADSGVAVEVLVDAMIEVAEDRLAAAVESGAIEVERADRVADSLRARVQAFVDASRVISDRAPGDGPQASQSDDG